MKAASLKESAVPLRGFLLIGAAHNATIWWVVKRRTMMCAARAIRIFSILAAVLSAPTKLKSSRHVGT